MPVTRGRDLHPTEAETRRRHHGVICTTFSLQGPSPSRSHHCAVAVSSPGMGPRPRRACDRSPPSAAPDGARRGLSVKGRE